LPAGLTALLTGLCAVRVLGAEMVVDRFRGRSGQRSLGRFVRASNIFC